MAIRVRILPVLLLRLESDAKLLHRIDPYLFLIALIELVVIGIQMLHSNNGTLTVNRFLYLELVEIVPVLGLFVFALMNTIRSDPEVGFIICTLVIIP
jgi:hypothetical protein